MIKFLLFIFFATSNLLYAQDIIDDISAPISLGDTSELFTETIKIISGSRRIFIITNDNQMLSKGDFITLVLDQTLPVARAIVAKNHEGDVGIKILKIYSLKNWSRIKSNLAVQILKGDDSRLFVKKEDKVKKNVTKEFTIEDEEDLFNEKALMDSDDFSDDDNRIIKQDNIVSIGFGQQSINDEAKEMPGGKDLVYTSNQFSASYAYQFQSDFWVEGLYAYANMGNVPTTQAETDFHNFSLRVKYTIKAPFYSYVLPYVGYQLRYWASGYVDDLEEIDPDLKNETENYLNKITEDKFIFGVTLLKRLVPGWFVKADLGTDIINVGFAIEF
jgi:hypothetical protein